MVDPFEQRDTQRARMGFADTKTREEEVGARNQGFGEMVAMEVRRQEALEREKALKKLAEMESGPKTATELGGDVAQESRNDAITQARAIDNSKRNVRVDNRFYEADKRLTDEAEGVTSVRPVMDPVTGQPMLRPVFDEAGNVMRNSDGSPQVEMVTETVESPGFIERQRTTQDAAGQESIRAEQRLSDVMDEQNRATEMAMVDQQAQEFAYDERLRAQEQAVQRSNQLVADATKKLTNFADDPWQDKGAGFKTLAVLQGVLSGFVGQDATKVLQQAIDTEMDGLRSALGASQGTQNAALDTYRTIMAETDDQRQADLMMEAARLEAARAEFLQKQQEFGILVLSADHQAFLADLDEMIAQKHNQAQRMAAANVPFTTRTVSTMGRAERMAREKLIGQDIKTAGDATKFGLGQAGALELEGVKGQAAQRAAATKARAEGAAKQEMDIKKATDEWGAVETLVNDFLDANPGDVAGVGMPLSGSQNDRIKTRNFQSALELLLTTGFTGATATDRQIEQIRNMIEGGTWEVTDDAFKTRMRQIRNIASARRRYYQDQLGSPDAAVVNTSELSSFQPE